MTMASANRKKSFTILTSKPNRDNPYIYLYNNAKNNGKSRCISGKPVDRDCNVLCNCVGWACGRFNHIYNEITGYKGIKFPNFCCNAENFIEVAKDYGLKIGDIPKPGAIMVWQKGNTLSRNDGAGHVAIVEKVYDANTVMTSESGYNHFVFSNKDRYEGYGNWGANTKYTFRGFIYNPAVCENPISNPVMPNNNNIPNPSKDRNCKENQIYVKVTKLRIRDDCSLNGKVLGYAKPGYYTYSDINSNNNYNWYKIGNNAWIAHRYDWTDVHPKENTILKVGDKVRIKEGSPIFGGTRTFASWVYSSTLYVRSINGNRIVISIYPTGPITGSIDRKYIIE